MIRKRLLGVNDARVPLTIAWIAFVVATAHPALGQDATNAAAPSPVTFTKDVAPVFQRVLASIFESRALAALRNALLGKLVSGGLWFEDPARIPPGR